MHKAAEPAKALPLTSVLDFSVFVGLFRGELNVLRARGAEKLIQIARQHTVIQLARFVGASAIQPLKALAGGQHVDLPWLKRRKSFAHGAI